MGVSVKLDEDLSPIVGAPMSAAGHEVRTVVGQGWRGFKDDELWPMVLAERVFFVTADKGFGDIRVYPPGTHPGILLLRPDRESVIEYRALVESVLARYDLATLAGALVVATPRSIHIRRAGS